MLTDNGLELLTQEAAWDLLSGEEVGRVGITLGGLPVILPVNFVVLDGTVVFRTGSGSKLSAAAAGAIVAFEVDSHDRETRSGWSVLVVGRSEVVHDLDATFQVLAAKLEPFADGSRPSLVRIHPDFVSGRRIVHAQERRTEPAASNDVVYVADSIGQPFEDVRRALTEASALMSGSVTPISASLVTFDLDSAGRDGSAELRILPLRGGRDAMTELVLISTDEEGSPTDHAAHVAEARKQLDGVVNEVGRVLAPLAPSPAPAAERDVASP